MLPQARRTCSSCLRFTHEPPIDFPAFSGRKDAAKRATLAKAASLFARVEQNVTDSFPLKFQDPAPLLHGGRRGLPPPPLACSSGTLEAPPGRVPVNSLGNGSRHHEAPLINLFVSLHSLKCTTAESGEQSPAVGRENLTGSAPSA